MRRSQIGEILHGQLFFLNVPIGRQGKIHGRHLYRREEISPDFAVSRFIHSPVHRSAKACAVGLLVPIEQGEPILLHIHAARVDETAGIHQDKIILPRINFKVRLKKAAGRPCCICPLHMLRIYEHDRDRP